MYIAQIDVAAVPWPVTGNWMLGLIGVLGVVCLILGVAQQSRRLFGKHPPVSEELIRIDGDLRRELARAIQECERRHNALRVENDEHLREFAVERARSLGELHEKINAVASDVAYIRGNLAQTE